MLQHQLQVHGHLLGDGGIGDHVAIGVHRAIAVHHAFDQSGQHRARRAEEQFRDALGGRLPGGIDTEDPLQVAVQFLSIDADLLLGIVVVAIDTIGLVGGPFDMSLMSEGALKAGLHALHALRIGGEEAEAAVVLFEPSI